jgi:hypothetical protein
LVLGLFEFGNVVLREIQLAVVQHLDEQVQPPLRDFIVQGMLGKVGVLDELVHSPGHLPVIHSRRGQLGVGGTHGASGRMGAQGRNQGERAPGHGASQQNGTTNGG